jgi:hypothetical protein
MMPGQRRNNLALVALFLLIIALPLASNLSGRDGADPHAEKRELAAFPTVEPTLASITSFGKGLTRWFDDHFGFRSTFVRWYGQTRLFWLGVSPSSSVIVGRDRWLFYADDSALDDYVSAAPFTTEDLEAWRGVLEDTARWLSARNVAFVFTVAPDKHAVYPEHMPVSVHPMTGVTRGGQLLAHLQAHSHLSTVDLRRSLAFAKTRERIYQVTDTHWNDRGALVAYQELIAAVRGAVPSVPPAWSRDDFVEVEQVREGLDLARMIGLKSVLRETDLLLIPKRPRVARVVEPADVDPSAEEGRLVTEIPGSTLPRAVVVRDSFASRLAPFLSEHFSRVVYLWQNYVDVKTIEDERPAVVIQEIVGRHLLSVAPYDDVPNAH